MRKPQSTFSVLAGDERRLEAGRLLVASWQLADALVIVFTPGLSHSQTSL